MDKRLFLAIALSMLVLIGYYLVFPPPQPTKPPAQPANAEAPAQPAQGSTTATAPAQDATSQAPALATATTAPAAPAPAAPAAASADPGRPIVVDTPLYKATLNTRGGVMTAFELKRYKVGKENINWGDLVPLLRRYTNNLPFIHGWLDKPKGNLDAAENMAPSPEIGDLALGLRLVGEDDLTRKLAGAPYQPSQDALRVSEQQSPASLVLKSATVEGLAVEKRLTFHPDTYIVDYAVSVANYGATARPLRMASIFGEGPEGAHGPKHFRGHQGPIWREDGSLETESAEDVAPTRVVPKPEWVGVADTYFITVAQAKSPVDHAFYEAKEMPLAGGKIWIAGYGMELPQVQLEPGKMVTSQFKLYLGPKRVSQMEKFGAKLETSLDLTLDVLAQPMLALMRWFYSFTGNYGVSIILLTIVVRLLLFPLTYRGMLNIKRMQKLQPRMVALREKYKGDKERLNKEMMAMYRKHKMNPIGGCLPIALQIPIFFALYSALLGAIELRHEPFMLWITDLSSKDGLYITPLLMGGSMVMQQRMTPTAMDPTQAKIMMWMPVIFTFFMMGFPSGLTLYWLTSNTLSILQQAIINRIKVPEPQD